MGPLGIPELLIILVSMAFWITIVGAVVWGLVTINRIRRAQERMAATLQAIEAALRRGQ